MSSKNSSFIKVKLFNKYLYAYIDTGATICLAQAKILPIKYWKKMIKPIKVRIANNKVIHIWYKAVDLVLLLEGKRFPLPSVYQQDAGLPLILGNNFLKLYNPFIQTLETISLRCPQLEKQPSSLITTKIYNTFSLFGGVIVNILKQQIYIAIEDEVTQLLEAICSQNPLDPQKNRNQIIVHIDLIDPTKEVNVPNRIPYTQKDIDEFREETSKQIELGILRQSKSPHSAPAFYVENHNEIKRGKRRLVINYKMNKATKGDAYNLDRLYLTDRESNWFSTLDAKSGFLQLRLDEETKPLTAFSCPPQMHLEYNVMPMGLKQAPSQFQRFMDNNLRGLEDISLAYIDDIIVFTKGTKDYHLKQVARVLIQLGNHGVILSKEKAKIAFEEIEFLGLKILKNGFIEPQKHLLEKIAEFPDQLQDRKQIQKFLGCLNYIGEKGFFKELAKERKVLQKMLSEKLPWKWNDLATLAVKRLKQVCKNLPRLYVAKPSDLLILTTDASDTTWGAVLMAVPNAYEEFLSFVTNNRPSDLKTFLKQKEGSSRYAEKSVPEKLNSMHDKSHGEKAEKSVSRQTSQGRSSSQSQQSYIGSFMITKWSSGTFKPAEENYTVHEKELLAFVNALKKFQIDLRPVKFIFQTDNSWVQGFLVNKLKETYNRGRLARWSMFIQQFDFISLHIAGKENYLADTLTREWKTSSR
ncbi:reverse transcriptase [Peanut chlorotic streak virus]|uniref:RNA-directed DNA polymerase n=1 Tax=Peanut chlorotic streak virus TaxID=35593 RepID=Q84682_9VIRU|nr:reverse transcriptase [Peanut chlorotic streak virus]AAA50240.1 reverse transcriptase [Peanut chlorotic streak virus]